MAETTHNKVKKQVWDMFDAAGVDLSKSGKDKRQEIWSETLGYYFTRYRDRATKKWKKRTVSDYGFRAVAAIIKEAKRLSGGGTVTATHLGNAADYVIPKFRKFCPEDVKPENMNDDGAVELNGALCELY